MFKNFRPGKDSVDELPSGTSSKSAIPHDNLNESQPLSVNNTTGKLFGKLKKQTTEEKTNREGAASKHDKESINLGKPDFERSESKEIATKENNQTKKESEFKELKEKGNDFAREVKLYLELNKFISSFSKSYFFHELLKPSLFSYSKI